MSLIEHPTGSYQHPDDPGEPTTGVPRLSITDLEAEILAALVVDRTVLEIGTGLGVSTRALASTALSVHTVDVDEWVWENVWPTLPDNVTGLKDHWDGFQTYDAIFIDGDHTTKAVQTDVRIARKHSRKGGLILAHDTNYPHVRAGLDFGWQFIPTTHGVGVCWVK